MDFHGGECSNLLLHSGLLFGASQNLGKRSVLDGRLDEARVEAVVRQAAGSRAVLVRAFRRKCEAVSPAEGLSTVGSASILLGVRVDATMVLRALDMGPAADDAAAAKAFQQFWGQKAELRRFPVSRQSRLSASHVDLNPSEA